jgi:hypothetical protein
MAHSLQQVVSQFKLSQSEEPVKAVPLQTSAVKPNGHKPAYKTSTLAV